MFIAIFAVLAAWLAMSCKIGEEGEFAFPLVVDDAESIPKQYQGLYAKADDGKFVLDQGVAKRLDVSKLTKALDSERKNAKDLQKMVQQWKELGDDPAEIRAKLDKIKEIEEGKGDDKSKDDKVKSMLDKMKRETEATIAKMKGDFDAQVHEKDEALAMHLIQKEVVSELAAAKGSTKVLTKTISDQCVLFRNDDKTYTVRIVDEAGEPRGDGRGGFLTIKGLIAELRADPDYAKNFEGSGRSGGGMPPNSGHGRGGTPNVKLTPQEKIERGLQQQFQR